MEKIIFVTNFFGNGGAARVMSTLIEYFSKEGRQVEIVSFLNREDTYKIPENVKYTVLEYKRRKQKNTKSKEFKKDF